MSIMPTHKSSKLAFIITLTVISFSLSGCQKIMDRTVNNIPLLPEGSKVSRYSGGGTLGGKWTRDGQCKVLLNWANKMKEEYPDLKFDNRGGSPPIAYYANLFRDSYFVPVFGTPYKEMDSATKTNLWRNIIYNDGCIGFGRFNKYQKDFDPYRGLLSNAFNDVSYGGKQLSAAVDGINREENRKEEALKQIENASMTSASFQELRAYAKPAKTNIKTELPKKMRGFKASGTMPVYHNTTFSTLWPSEAEAFHVALDKKLKLIARELVKGSVREATDMRTSLPNARKLKNELIPQNEEFLKLLDNSSSSGSPKEMIEKKLDDMIASLTKERTLVLDSIPNTAEGLSQSLNWQSDFQKNFSEFKDFPVVEEAGSRLTQKRNTIYRAIKPDFVEKLNLMKPDLSNLTKAEENLETTFILPLDQSLPSYQEYSNMVKIHQNRILTQLLQTQSDKLHKISPTLSGALGILNWKNEFDRIYSPYQKFSPVQAVYKDWNDKRQAILQKAKAEFIEKQESLSPDREGISQATDMLDGIFPNLEDENLPIYDEYQAITLSNIKELKRRMR